MFSFAPKKKGTKQGLFLPNPTERGAISDLPSDAPRPPTTGVAAEIAKAAEVNADKKRVGKRKVNANDISSCRLKTIARMMWWTWMLRVMARLTTSTLSSIKLTFTQT